MTPEQLSQLMAQPRTLVAAAQLQDQTPRTLLYGYTCERNTWHVYLDANGVLHRVCYRFEGDIVLHTQGPSAGVTCNEEFVPDKRLYPESCDFEFCQLLTRQGVELPFTTYTDGAHAKRTENSVYAGKTAEQLTAGRVQSA